jgi:hypothetical protein
MSIVDSIATSGPPPRRISEFEIRTCPACQMERGRRRGDPVITDSHTHAQHPSAPYLRRVLTEDGDDGSRLPNGFRAGEVERNRDYRIKKQRRCGKSFGPVVDAPEELQCFVCERKRGHDGDCSEEPDCIVWGGED